MTRARHEREPSAVAAGTSLVLKVDAPGFDVIDASGSVASRSQRAMHTLLRTVPIQEGPGWEGRLAGTTFEVEQRGVLALEFPLDAERAGVVPAPQWSTGGVVEPVRESARPSPLALDLKGFFKIRVLYEQGVLAADYHAADGRHVETLQARRGEDLLAAIVGGDYLGAQPARAQHVVYLAVQIGRADFALRTGLAFEEGQPLSDAARRNVDHHLYAAEVVAGASLEDTWVLGLSGLRERGLLTNTQKGRVAEGWGTFFVIPGMEAMAIPAAYAASEEHIDHYAAELLAAAPDVRARGDYTYGDRTSHYFHSAGGAGVPIDQIAESGRALAADPTVLRIHQRWDPSADLLATAHHRPCLVFDLWFPYAGRLHTLQIARSHDVFGGLPQNALGVARGWGRALAAASGIPLGDLVFLSISNNYRVGDDAENVRKAMQGGAHAPAQAAVLPRPHVERPTSEAALGSVFHGSPATATPITAAYLAEVEVRPVGTAREILAAAPALAERLLAYRGTLDQVATLVARLAVEASAATRDRSNSLFLSPRDPVRDRAGEATPLVCFQVRRQLGSLHATSVVVGDAGVALAPLLLDLQRTIARAVGIPAGSALLVRVAEPRSVHT